LSGQHIGYHESSAALTALNKASEHAWLNEVRHGSCRSGSHSKGVCSKADSYELQRDMTPGGTGPAHATYQIDQEPDELVDRFAVLAYTQLNADLRMPA